jgi:hypothetical protein
MLVGQFAGERMMRAYEREQMATNLINRFEPCVIFKSFE